MGPFFNKTLKNSVFIFYQKHCEGKMTLEVLLQNFTLDIKQGRELCHHGAKYEAKLLKVVKCGAYVLSFKPPKKLTVRPIMLISN